MEHLVGYLEKNKKKGSKCSKCYEEGFPCYSCEKSNVKRTSMMSWEEYLQCLLEQETEAKHHIYEMTYESERKYRFSIFQDSEACHPPTRERHQDRFDYLIIRALLEEMYKFEKYEENSFDIFIQNAEKFEKNKFFTTWGITGNILRVYLTNSFQEFPECINNIDYVEVLENHKIKPHFVEKFMSFISKHEDKLHLII